MVPCLFNLGTGEIIIIVVVILLLFGAKRIPELARSVGKGINSFKQGLNDVSSETNSQKHDINSTSTNQHNKETEK